MEISKCPVCGRNFMPTRKGNVFCSESCKKKFAYADTQDYTTKKCPRCDVKFIPKRSDQIYCSKLCQRNPSTQISHDLKRFGGNRELALRRDGYKCVMCGRIDGVNVHHKDDSGNSENPNNDPDNLISLCDACHMKTHKIHKRRTRKYADVTCGFCGKTFETTKELIAEGGGKFCSKKCQYAKMSQPQTRFIDHCQVCGKEFWTTPYKQSLGKGKYCGRECYQTAQIGVHKNRPITKQTITKCLECGKEITTTPYYIKTGRDKYCSKQCMYKGRSKIMTKNKS